MFKKDGFVSSRLWKFILIENNRYRSSVIGAGPRIFCGHSFKKMTPHSVTFSQIY
ncbi:Uncharacterized protein AC511_0479 [Pseudomonas coronafaciens pv. oryzae]|nr:Uncharacterized protein AC511_0479 [Pseudomonas coronafaciens pv. oryzae]